jgi:hypothetical protein
MDQNLAKDPFEITARSEDSPWNSALPPGKRFHEIVRERIAKYLALYSLLL